MKNNLTSKELLILNYCEQPRSVNELAELMQKSYYTIRNYVYNLVRSGWLMETVSGRNREKTYVSKWDQNSDKPVVKIPLGDRSITARYAIVGFRVTEVPNKAIYRIMQGLLTIFYNHTDEYGSGIPDLAALEVIRKVFDLYKQHAEAVEILLSLPWTDPDKMNSITEDLFKDPEFVERLADDVNKFQHYVNESHFQVLEKYSKKKTLDSNESEE